jgi:transposase
MREVAVLRRRAAGRYSTPTRGIIDTQTVKCVAVRGPRGYVRREPGQKGFVVLPRRWVVERGFDWLAHWGGLLRDRARRPQCASQCQCVPLDYEN